MEGGLTRTVKVLVNCQEQGCADECSYHLDMVRMWLGAPICQGCFEDTPRYDPDQDWEPKWSDLTPVELKDLRA